MKTSFLLFLLILPSSLLSQRYQLNLKVRFDEEKYEEVVLSRYNGHFEEILDTFYIDGKGRLRVKTEQAYFGGLYRLLVHGYPKVEFIVHEKKNQFSVGKNGAYRIKDKENRTYHSLLNSIEEFEHMIDDFDSKLSSGKFENSQERLIDSLKIVEKSRAIYSEIQENEKLFASRLVLLKLMAHNVNYPRNRFWILPPNMKESRPLNHADVRMLFSRYAVGLIDYLEEYARIADERNLRQFIDSTLEQADQNKHWKRYLLSYWLAKYSQSLEIPQEEAFVHLVTKHLPDSCPEWMDPGTFMRYKSIASDLLPLQIGKTVPEIALWDTSGQKIDLRSIKGKYVLLVFWDVDCNHCQKMMPLYRELYEKYKQHGFEVYAIYTEDQAMKWENELEEKDYNWINVADLKWETNFRNDFRIRETPTVFLLDSSYQIVGRRMNAEELSDYLKRNLH